MTGVMGVFVFAYGLPVNDGTPGTGRLGRKRSDVTLSASVSLRRHCLLLLLLVGMAKPGLVGQVQTIGKWTTQSYTIPINPIHVALLHNGKILVVAGSGNCPASLPGCPGGAPFGPSNNSGALLVN